MDCRTSCFADEAVRRGGGPIRCHYGAEPGGNPRWFARVLKPAADRAGKAGCGGRSRNGRPRRRENEVAHRVLVATLCGLGRDRTDDMRLGKRERRYAAFRHFDPYQFRQALGISNTRRERPMMRAAGVEVFPTRPAEVALCGGLPLPGHVPSIESPYYRPVLSGDFSQERIRIKRGNAVL